MFPQEYLIVIKVLLRAYTKGSQSANYYALESILNAIKISQEHNIIDKASLNTPTESDQEEEFSVNQDPSLRFWPTKQIGDAHQKSVPGR
jgi:hypothetical protein